MTKLTFTEIETILNSDIFSENDHGPESWMLNDIYETANVIEEEGEFKEMFEQLGKYKFVDEFGGEGHGEDYWTVYHFIDHDVYIQFDGWYASHAGTEFDSMFEVKPEEVTVTRYTQI